MLPWYLCLFLYVRQAIVHYAVAIKSLLCLYYFGLYQEIRPFYCGVTWMQELWLYKLCVTEGAAKLGTEGTNWGIKNKQKPKLHQQNSVHICINFIFHDACRLHENLTAFHHEQVLPGSKLTWKRQPRKSCGLGLCIHLLPHSGSELSILAGTCKPCNSFVFLKWHFKDNNIL